MDGTGFKAFLLDGSGGAQLLDRERAAAWRREQGILWLSLDHASDREAGDLLRRCGLEALAVEAMTEPADHPRVMIHGEARMLSLRCMEAADDGEWRMVPVNLWVERGRIITVRHPGQCPLLERLAADLAAGRGPVDAGEILVAMLRDLAARVQPVVDDLVRRSEAFGEQVYEPHAKNSLGRRMGQLRRAVTRCLHHLEPQAETLHALWHDPPALLQPGQRQRLGEVRDRFRRFSRDLESCREQLKGYQDELNTLIDHRLNLHVYVLTMLNGVLLPLMFATGLLGVNVGGIPGAQDPRGFLWLCLLLVGMAVVMYLVFRRKRWL